jgi:hypothetical protein
MLHGCLVFITRQYQNLETQRKGVNGVSGFKVWDLKPKNPPLPLFLSVSRFFFIDGRNLTIREAADQ